MHLFIDVLWVSIGSKIPGAASGFTTKEAQPYYPVYEDDNECIICQEDMKDNNSLKLQCGHRFHKAVSSNVMHIYVVYVSGILIWLIGKIFSNLFQNELICICIA